jgi:hypothetical protein
MATPKSIRYSEKGKSIQMGESLTNDRSSQRNDQPDSETSARLGALEKRIDALEKQIGHQRGPWLERFMYWAIVIGLIIAIIRLA